MLPINSCSTGMSFNSQCLLWPKNALQFNTFHDRKWSCHSLPNIASSALQKQGFFTLSLYRVHESAEKFLWFHVRKAPHSDCGNTTPDQLSQLCLRIHLKMDLKNAFLEMFHFHNEGLRNDCFCAAHNLNKPIKYTSSNHDCSSFKNPLQPGISSYCYTTVPLRF